MKFNLPLRVRQVIYIVATIATPTFTYLNQQGSVSDFSFGLYAVIVGAVTALAAVNTRD